MRRRFLPRGSGGLVGTVLVFIGIVLLVVMALFIDRGSTYNEQIWQNVADGLPQDTYGVALLGRQPDVDLVAGTVTITWRPYACGNLTATSVNGCIWQFARPVDFYFDGADTPTFTVDPGKIGRQAGDPANFFDTQNVWNLKYVHNINAGTWDGHLSLQYHFPFDSFSVDTLFKAVDKLTGAAIPIVDASLTETQTSYTKTWESFFPLVLQANSSSPALPAANLAFILGRSRSVMAFTMILFLVNWLLTLLVLHITVYYIIENYKSDKKDVAEVPREILLLPVSVILTVPSLRAAMPSVPDFGIMLDIIGYFFDIVIISVCSMILILLLIYQRKPKEDSKESPDTGKDLVDSD